MSARQSSRKRVPNSKRPSSESDPRGGYRRFTRASVGGQKLTELFTNNVLSGSENPDDVYSKYPIFHAHSALRFSQYFKKYSDEFKNTQRKPGFLLIFSRFILF